MNIISMEMLNFLSFESFKYDFKQGEPTIVIGENLTDDSQRSNGSGKSALQCGLEYCLYTTTSKKTTIKDLVNWYTGAVEASVSLTIHCPIRNETLLIERKIHLKNGGSSQLSINGVIKWGYDDRMTEQVDKFILSWIGITKEDLQNYFIINKFRYTSFFDSSNTKIIQLIGRFSNATLIEGLDKEILKKVEVHQFKQTAINEEISNLEGQKTVYLKNIESEKNRDFDQEKEVEISETKGKITIISGEIDNIITSINKSNASINESKQTIESYNENLKEVDKQLSNLKLDGFDKEYQELQDKVDKTKVEQNILDTRKLALKRDKEEAESLISEIEKNLKGSVKCPKCSHEFSISDPNIDIESEREQLEEITPILREINTSINSITNSLKEFETKLKDFSLERGQISAKEEQQLFNKRSITKKLDSIKSDIQLCSQEVSHENNKIISYNKNIELKRKQIADLNIYIDEIKNRVTDNSKTIKGYEESIENIDKQISSKKHDIEVLNVKISDIKYWSVTYKEFSQYLGVKVLKVLQSYMNKFLEEMRSDLRVKVEGYKLKSDGTTSEKISVYVLRNGEIREFSSFSGGERARLELASILTIQRAVNSTNKFGGISFCSIDEVLESADTLGINNIMKSLKGSGNTIMLTTHLFIDDDSDFCKLKIIKEFGISRIEK